jgi:aminopeptidase N
LSITVPNGFTGVANMPIEKTESPAPGLHKLTFAMTPPMATYLFNFEAGDFESIGATAAGIPIRVVTTRGKAQQGLYALQIATRVLPWYNEYFGVRYPLPKLDLIALPKDTGAMENWGAITFDESALLFDPATSPPQNQSYIFNTVAHEMAHQWFGDLVTMTWWDNLWLNESFASWMALKATEHFNPHWQTWVDVADEKNQSMETDATHTTHPIQQPVHDPSEADSVFDDITYGKGSSVIRMLEGYLGPAVFQKGIQRYMQVHQYGNTSTTDLWQALEDASGQPIPDIARTWTETAGFPLVAIEGSSDTQLMTQQRFYQMPPQPSSVPWKVPLTFVGLTSDQTVPGPSLLEDASIPLPRQGAPFKLNAHGTGYYRVLYASQDLDAILKSWGALSPSDRLELLQDQWALVGACKADPATWLQLVGHMRPGDDLYLYPTLAAQLEAIDRVLRGSERRQFRQFALARLHPVLARLGWTIQPDEPPVKLALRAQVLDQMGRYGDRDVQREAHERFRRFVSDPASLPTSLKPAVLSLVAASADEHDFDTLHDLALREADFTQKRMIYQAMGNVEDVRLATRLLDLALGNELPGDTGVRLVRRVADTHPDLAWHFALQHARELLGRLSVFEKVSYLPEIAEMESDSIHADELETYAREHPDSMSRIPMDKAVEAIRFSERFKHTVVPRLLHASRQ